MDIFYFLILLLSTLVQVFRYVKFTIRLNQVNKHLIYMDYEEW